VISYRLDLAAATGDQLDAQDQGAHGDEHDHVEK